MTTTTPSRTLSRADTAAMWLFIVVGIGVFVVSVVAAVTRIASAFGSAPVHVPAWFAGTRADAPIGPDGAAVSVELDRAILTTDALSAAGKGALVLEQVVAVAAIGSLIGCLIALTVSTMRGRVFSRRNTVLVTTAGIALFLWIFGVPFFGNMVANDAFRAISAGTFDNAIATVDVTGLFLAAFVIAISSTVFTVGERLQRETEGLV